MCVSVFTAFAVPASAAYISKTDIYVSNSEFDGNTITYTVGVKNGVKKLTGANIQVNYNVDQLEVVECVVNEKTFSGLSTNGPVINSPGVYAVGFINATGITPSSDSALFTISFKVIAADRPYTTVGFKCIEFITDDGVDNDLKKGGTPSDLGDHSFLTLAKPSNINVDSVGNGLKVTWDAVDGAASYDVYRKAASESAFSKINTAAVVSLEYFDETITKGEEYSYNVVAVNTHGATELAGDGAKGLNFGEISSLQTAPDSKGIKVTWAALNGAEKYEISRKLSSETNWKAVATVNAPATSYTDTSAQSGQEYNYKVRAIKGVYSAGVSASVQIPVAKYLAMPGVNAANSADGIKVSITAVGGGETYTLSKSTSGSEYVVLKEIAASEFSNGVYTYTDSSVSENVQYNYAVQANASDIQSDVSKLSAYITRLATPVVNAASLKNTDNGISFEWAAVSGASSYDVYRKTTGGDYICIGNRTTLSFTDTTASNSVKYTYTVVARDAFGGVGAYNETGWSITRLITPTGLSTSAVSTGVKVTWGAVAGAEKYVIYRATTTGDFVKIGEATTTAYTDTSAAKDVLYRYTVQACANGSESAYNAAGVQGKNFGTVSTLKTALTANGVKLTWNLLSGADGYIVYRKAAGSSSFTTIKQVGKVDTFEDTTIPSGVSCEYKVIPFSGTCYGVMTASIPAIKYLSIPKVDASNAGDGMVSVVFSAVPGAENYVIERADGEGSTAFKQIATVKATQYMDTKNIVAGRFYTYRVKAVAGDLQSAYGSDSLTKMIAPTVTGLKNEIAGIRITWTAVADATGYNIYRKKASDTTWVKIRGNIASTTYVDASVASGEAWQYTVEAITPDGTTGYNLIGDSLLFLETPDLNSIKNSTNSVTLTWGQVKGATHYKIYRRGAGQGYKCIATIPAGTTTYIDKQSSKSNSIQSGSSYKYTVRAQFEDSTGAKTLSNYLSGGIYVRYLATPDVKSVANSASGITVKWNKVSGAKGYYIYRKTYSNGKWGGWKRIATAKNTASSYTDKSISKNSGKYYRYTVRAYNGSAASAYESGIYTKRLMMPSISTATSTRSGVSLKWNSVGSASGYYIYRKTGNGSWKRIATVKGRTNVTYVDKSARRGVTYRYTVRAYNGKYTSAYNSTGKTCKDIY